MSDRVYRAAWSPERAFALLEEESHAYDQTMARPSCDCAPLATRGSPAGPPSAMGDLFKRAFDRDLSVI